MIEWKEEYSVGVEEIDNQHHKLFEIAIEIERLLKDKYRVDKYDNIMELVEELREYTKYHFAAEEKYMLDIKYKKFFSHKMEHDEFIEKISHLDENEIDTNQDEYLCQVLAFVVKWLVEHILEKDKLVVL